VNQRLNFKTGLANMKVSVLQLSNFCNLRRAAFKNPRNLFEVKTVEKKA